MFIKLVIEIVNYIICIKEADNTLNSNYLKVPFNKKIFKNLYGEVLSICIINEPYEFLNFAMYKLLLSFVVFLLFYLRLV